MPRWRYRTLGTVSAADLARLAGGYISEARYEVAVSEGRGRFAVMWNRVPLPTPFVKRFARPAEELRRYRRLVRQGWSLGAYDGGTLVGIVLAEPRAWNRSVWIRELGVAASHRRRGIGRRLIAEVFDRARAEGYRVLVCETQATNAPAIDFYRAAGFRLEGLDASYYSNEDLERGEVALFMKRPVPARRETVRGSSRRGRSSK